ncbi:MAG: TOTE conflict system archaeo-eukaryotic primase domain-containing protein [Egibacteraceae bacterium]
MSEDVAERLAAALAELEQLRAENARLRGLVGLDERRVGGPVRGWEPTLFPEEQPAVMVDEGSSDEAKLALFRSLFVGRDDVYALRWQSTRSGKAGWSRQCEAGGPGRTSAQRNISR